MSLVAKIIEDLENKLKEKDEENLALQYEIRCKNEEIERLDQDCSNNGIIRCMLLVTTMISISLIILIK